MKIFVLMLILFAALAAQSQTNIIYDNVSSFGQSPRTNLTVTLTLVQPKNRYNIVTHQFVSNDPVQSTTDTNGNFVFTNICNGFYRLNLSDSTSSSWPIQIWPDTMGTNTLGSLVNWAVLNSPNNWSNYLNAAQIYALLASVSSSGATNVFWNTSTNLSGANRAKIIWVYGNNPPYSTTNPPPYSIIYTN